MSSTAQRNLSGGEISPSLYARTDQLKYQTGLRTCRNFLVMRHGGAANRPGLHFVGETKKSDLNVPLGQVRLFKFVFVNGSVNNTYVLEFGERYVRFYQDGARIEVPPTPAAWVTATLYHVGDLVSRTGSVPIGGFPVVVQMVYYCIQEHTSGASTDPYPGTGANYQTVWAALEPTATGSVYEIPSPYLVADLPEIRIAQSKDVITLTHHKYPVQELRRMGHTQWTLLPVTFGPGIGVPTTLALASGVATGDLYAWAVTAVDGITGEEGLPATVTNGSANHKPDAATPTVISWAAVAGASEYNIYRSTDGETFLYIGTTGGVPLAGVSTTWPTATNNVSTATRNAWVTGPHVINTTVGVATDRATDGKYTIKVRVSVQAQNAGSAPDQTKGRVRMLYSRNGEPLQDGGFLWEQGLPLFGVGIIGPQIITGILTVPDTGYATLTIELQPEVFGTGAGGGCLFSCTIDATVAPNDRVTWNKGGTSFRDTAMVPDAASTPPKQATNLFAAPGQYPTAVGYIEQRLFLGNTDTDPERLWGSRPGIFHSFTQSSPIQDDDSVSFRLAGTKVQAIQHFLELVRMLIFTGSGEKSVNDEGTPISPTTFKPVTRSEVGTGILAPQLVISDVLFVQHRGAKIRNLKRGDQEFSSADLTVMAPHLFDGYEIVDWDYAQEPHSILWVVRSDGVLLGLTYLPDQEVWGWHRHDTDGVIENVCVVPEGREDRVYAVVKRKIFGVDKRYIERLNSRAITALTDVRDLEFMDSALSYDGRNTSAETMALTGGTLWDETETLTITRSIGGFTAGEIGNAIFFTAADGTPIRVLLTGFTSGTVMAGQADRIVPVALRGVATAVWSRAVDQVTGLAHLAGKAVSIYADGLVIASSNNAKYAVVTVSAGGVVDLDQPYAVIHVGLPYTSDLETLDIDTASGPSLKERFMSVGHVGVFVEKSRPFFAGRAPPKAGQDPLYGLQELKLRESEGYDDPVALLTSDETINIDQHWDTNGRVFLRQVDPVPTTILSIIPMGKL